MAQPDKAGFPHFMLKEIFEQPRAMRDTIAPLISHRHVSLEEVRIAPEEFRSLKQITIVASGTSRHAGMAARYMIQELAGVPVEVDYASEFEYRRVAGLGELTIVITQSGETADTTAAQRKAKAQGSRTLAISNVKDSTIAREADAVICTNAGPEISIASTKAFTAQLAALFLFAVYLGEMRGTLNAEQAGAHLARLQEMPPKLERLLLCDPQCEELARQYYTKDDFLFIGRGVHYPIAMDGALKLKEVSYIHAEGYPAGEIKHGPYALIDEKMPMVAIATRDDNDPGSLLRYEKNVASLKQVKERGGQVIALAVEGDTAVPVVADHVVFLPPAPELLLGILEIVPLQLLAYHIAVHRGLDVDQPRNLVKSVTTE